PTRVDVISTASGKLIGSIPDTSGVHGIALAKALNRGFTSNGRANSVTVFDLDTLKVIQEVKIPGGNPDAILYEPTGKHVFTFNGASKNVTVLDASSLGVIATIPVPDKPEFAATDGRDRRAEVGRQEHLAAARLQQSERPGPRWRPSPIVFRLRWKGHGRHRC